MQNNLISVITPVYQGQKTLKRALQSLLDQTHENWECILCSDDGFDYLTWLSDEGITDERIRITYSSKKQSGPNIARNEAKALARGDWIAPLDADDLYYSDRLEILLKAADQTGLSVDNVNIVNDENQQQIGTAFEGSHLNQLAEDPMHHIGMEDFFLTDTPLLMLFHKSVASHNWERLPRGGDTIFNLRAIEKAGWATYHNEALHEYRIHDQSMCHAPDVGEVFQKAYELTLTRLKQDRLGFESKTTQNKVCKLINQKILLNREYEKARQTAPNLDFQSFRKSFRKNL